MENEHLLIYPLYIDSGRTRAGGRKCAKEAALSKPKYTEMKAAMDRLRAAHGIEYKPEPNKRHPKDPETSGRLAVHKTPAGIAASKHGLLGLIVATIREDRANKRAAEEKGKTPNLMNLVPIKKKKGKKNK